ncbi:hypothetical protein IV498_08920 [Paenarthrobacter sp. Z7-10]|uniref:hypothetical protein n=1 Tax=Paenarthrobacter sp. Z7-10 TaxID=2787635 RepID=UPI0022A8D3B4|nr:hypothetical protein [Paenarthrobacter sp. Z7-10]MCZ2403300.1 hypothetical protein [Paenarthrobacter sp. Z7-10]
MPSRFQLRGESLEGIEWRLFNSHGHGARIISAEKVTEGGIAGFFARHFYEVTVEVPDGPADRVASVAPWLAGPVEPEVPRTGIAALLHDADDGDTAGRRSPTGGNSRSRSPGARNADESVPGTDGNPSRAGRHVPGSGERGRHAGTDRNAGGASGSAGSVLGNAPGSKPGGAGRSEVLPQISTGSGDFAALLDELTSSVSPEKSRNQRRDAPAVPVLDAGPGRILMVVGLGMDPLETARSMGAALGGAVEIRTAGAMRTVGLEHVVGRNGLSAARSAATAAGRTVVVAFGLRTDGLVPAPALSDLDADQVWVAVDAARKPADTAAWVRKVGWATSVDALAVLGSQETLTPGTVNELGLAVGWVDGEPATRTIL